MALLTIDKAYVSRSSPLAKCTLRCPSSPSVLFYLFRVKGRMSQFLLFIIKILQSRNVIRILFGLLPLLSFLGNRRIHQLLSLGNHCELSASRDKGLRVYSLPPKESFTHLPEWLRRRHGRLIIVRGRLYQGSRVKLLPCRGKDPLG